MYHAAGEKVVGGCTERAIDLLQLIVSAYEMRERVESDNW